MRNLNDYHEQYKNRPFERFQVEFRKRRIRETLNRFSHETLLEVGCGLSSIFNTVSDYKNLYVVEPCNGFFDKAVADLEQVPNRKNVVVINDSIENAVGLLKDKRFDFVLLSSVLHEVADPRRFLGSIHEIAVTQTVIHINVPNAKSFHRLLAVEMGLIRDEFQLSESNAQLQQHNVFDRHSLLKLIGQAGFTVIESGTYAFKPFTHLQMENLIQAGVITETMLDGFYKMEKYLPDLGSEIYANVVKVCETV
jgi:2-polyprenyl-3-methyl-5-hydroxy-6-metoxy-1,4-benzoquinol methylase